MLLVVVGLAHMSLTVGQCQRLNAAARELIQQGEPAAVDVSLRGGLIIPRVLTRGVRVQSSGGEEPSVSFSYIASGNPPVLPLDIARQFLLGGLLLALAALVYWLGRGNSRFRDVLALLSGAAGLILATLLAGLTFT